MEIKNVSDHINTFYLCYTLYVTGASKLSGSTPIDLGTIMCGRCGGRYTISNAYNRTPEARVLYFKSSELLYSI